MPQKSFKMSKKPIFGGNSNVQKWAFWTFKLMSGVWSSIFRTLKCTFGVSGFRGSVAGRGVCNERAILGVEKDKGEFEVPGPPPLFW